MALIGTLFAVERKAKDGSDEERLALRQAQSTPVLAKLREKLMGWKEQLLPKHPMAEAVNYILSQWNELNVFQRAPSDATNATTSAMSSGLPIRFNACIPMPERPLRNRLNRRHWRSWIDHRCQYSG